MVCCTGRTSWPGVAFEPSGPDRVLVRTRPELAAGDRTGQSSGAANLGLTGKTLERSAALKKRRREALEPLARSRNEGVFGKLTFCYLETIPAQSDG